MFDIKQDPGGLVDVEFIVQFLVLGRAPRARIAAAGNNLGVVALLRAWRPSWGSFRATWPSRSVTFIATIGVCSTLTDWMASAVPVSSGQVAMPEYRDRARYGPMFLDRRTPRSRTTKRPLR